MNDVQTRRMMDYSEYEKIAPRLREKSLQISRMMGMNDDDALDVAQDVLLKLWQMRHELSRFRSLDALVAVFTRHRAVDLYRRNAHSASLIEVNDERERNYYNNSINTHNEQRKGTYIKPA